MTDKRPAAIAGTVFFLFNIITFFLLYEGNENWVLTIPFAIAVLINTAFLGCFMNRAFKKKEHDDFDLPEL